MSNTTKKSVDMDSGAPSANDAELHEEFSRALHDNNEPDVTWKTVVDADGVVIKQADDGALPQHAHDDSVGRKIGEQLVRKWFDRS